MYVCDFVWRPSGARESTKPFIATMAEEGKKKKSKDKKSNRDLDGRGSFFSPSPLLLPSICLGAIGAVCIVAAKGILPVHLRLL